MNMSCQVNLFKRAMCWMMLLRWALKPEGRLCRLLICHLVTLDRSAVYRVHISPRDLLAR